MVQLGLSSSHGSKRIVLSSVRRANVEWPCQVSVGISVRPPIESRCHPEAKPKDLCSDAGPRVEILRLLRFLRMTKPSTNHALIFRRIHQAVELGGVGEADADNPAT